MSEGHQAVNCDGRAQSWATRRLKPISQRKGEPEVHMNDHMRRLSTPWAIAVERSIRIANSEIAPGVILDPACGSGIHLAAMCLETGRVGLGIELDEEAGRFAAANMNRLLEKGSGPARDSNRILIGDGLDAEGALKTYHRSLENSAFSSAPPVSLLHVDPARPLDAQNHTLDEMAPSIGELLSAWVPCMNQDELGPALLLDLSPRLSRKQRGEIDAILDEVAPGSSRTWEWLSQGGGRIDRLSVWVGPLASESSHRAIRMGAKTVLRTVEAESPTPFISEKRAMPPSFDQWIVIVDPAVVEARLHSAWLASFDSVEYNPIWQRASLRRPILVSDTPPPDSLREDPFTVAVGRVCGHRLSSPDMENAPTVARAAERSGIGHLVLRCEVDPELHPKIQKRLNKALKGVEGDRGFIVDVPVSRGDNWHVVHVTCVES